MKKNLHRFVMVTLIVVLVFSFTAVFSSEVFDDSYLNSIVQLIKDSYLDDVDDRVILEGALKGIFDTMDDYTGYYTLEEAEKFFGDVDGTYEGIGVQIEKKGDYILIVRVFPGSPADMAGIIQGDRIISVDSKSISGLSAEEVSWMIKGEAGTHVTLGMVRGRNNEIVSMDVERKQIKVNPVTMKIVDDIAVIAVETFNANTREYFEGAILEADKKFIKKIILDLRNNPGGLVDQSVFLAEYFIPRGLITTLVFKDEDQDIREYYSKSDSSPYELVVLVNEMSASASEIVAGAVQDTQSGIVVGTKTYGKARVQSLIPILTPRAYGKYKERTGESLVNAFDLMGSHNINPLKAEILGWSKMTTGYYYTPSNRMIDGLGITPDVEVTYDPVINDVNLNGIRELTVTVKPGLDDEGSDVLNAQKILKILGYDLGPADGFLGEETARAVSKYRSDKKLWPGGVIDFTTQRALNEDLERLLKSHDKQYAKALELLK